MNKNDTEAQINQQKEHFLKVGERIRQLRIAHGWSIKGYEEMLCLPSGALHNIEHGEGGRGINFLAIINHLTSLGYSYKWLLEFDNDDYFKKKNSIYILILTKTNLLKFMKNFMMF